MASFTVRHRNDVSWRLPGEMRQQGMLIRPLSTANVAVVQQGRKMVRLNWSDITWEKG